MELVCVEPRDVTDRHTMYEFRPGECCTFVVNVSRPVIKPTEVVLSIFFGSQCVLVTGEIAPGATTARLSYELSTLAQPGDCTLYKVRLVDAKGTGVLFNSGMAKPRVLFRVVESALTIALVDLTVEPAVLLEQIASASLSAASVVSTQLVVNELVPVEPVKRNLWRFWTAD